MRSSLHAGAIGLIAAIGSAGAAIFPFVTGALAQKYGEWVYEARPGRTDVT